MLKFRYLSFDLFGHFLLPMLRMGCGSINDMFAFQGRQHGDSGSDLGWDVGIFRFKKKLGATYGISKIIWALDQI